MERNEGFIRAYMGRLVYEIISVRFENMILKYSKQFNSDL